MKGNGQKEGYESSGLFDRARQGLPGNNAFSLVELTLALGVAAFCLLAIFGLLPVGINSNQTAIEQTVAASIGRAIVADLRVTPIVSGSSRQFGLAIPGAGAPGVTGTALQTLYFCEDGSPSGKVGDRAVIAGKHSRYRGNIWFTPPTSGRAATIVRLLITWPALADLDPTVAPSNYAGCFEALTALDRN